MTAYSPCTDQTIWSGRVDAEEREYIYQTIQCLDLNHPPSQKLRGYGVLGFKSDTGIKRNLGNPGAALGPDAFRHALAKLPDHTHVMLYDAGNVKCLHDDLEAAQTELKQRVTQLLTLGLTPLVVGGGHETAWGHFQGLHAHYPKENIAILNFDAHFDLRPMLSDGRGSSGTPFRQINDYLCSNNKLFYYYCAGIQPFANTSSLFEYAKSQHVTHCLAETIQANPYDLTFIENILNAHEHVYVSVCLDVFHASIAPGVSAPQSLGIDSTYVLNALRRLKQSKCVIGLDLVELAPPYDINQRTSKLAAALALTFLSS